MPTAIQMEAYGPPDVLRPVEVADVEPAPGEVVVRTRVAGVNRADVFIRSGEWTHNGEWPYVPGLETAGTIEAVGREVAGFHVGDRVITMMQRLGGIHGERAGGYQDLVTVRADTLAHVPDGLTLEKAAQLGLPAVTAWLALEVLGIEGGMRVLVQGASGAVGAMALQMIDARGAKSVATGTRREKFEWMRRCGAAEVVNTKERGWPDQVGAVDRVLDLVGKATFGPSVAALLPEGRLVFVGGTSGGDLSFSGWDLMKPVALTGYSTETLTQSQLQAAIDGIAAEVRHDRLGMPGLTEFPLREASDAHRNIEAGRVQGRVVLLPD